ncbi:hypothetical protein [Metallosphaera sedula]|uniref:hypothetical protein n=1 Tax=Metallosphaera sedula TaxID=43687 RepID=UPI0020C0E48D|nr:hypothetical protein [Metallosphaera sedula]
MDCDSNMDRDMEEYFIDQLSDYAEYIGGGTVNNLLYRLEDKLGTKRNVFERIGISRGTLYSGYKISFETKKKIVSTALKELDHDKVVKLMIDGIIYTLNMLVLDYIKYLKSKDDNDKIVGIYQYAKDFLNDRIKTQIMEIEPKIADIEEDSRTTNLQEFLSSKKFISLFDISLVYRNNIRTLRNIGQVYMGSCYTSSSFEVSVSEGRCEENRIRLDKDIYKKPVLAVSK